PLSLNLALSIANEGALGSTKAEIDKLLSIEIPGDKAVLYKELIGTVDEKDKLKESQRAWLKNKVQWCALMTSGIVQEGSGYGPALDSCNLDITIKRIKDLEYLKSNLDCIGCPIKNLIKANLLLSYTLCNCSLNPKALATL
ncbi:MAG: lysozyme inhibitor LprI family protein, partial [Methylophilaceae bacterium]